MTASVNYLGEFIKFGGQAIIVVIGWVVVNKLSATREKDKSRKDIIIKSIDSICDSIDKLFEISRDYHSRSTRDHQAEIKIKMLLQDYSLRVASLKDLTGYVPTYIECQDDVLRFRQAITSSHFEDEHTNAEELNSEIFQKIAESALATKRNLITLKHSQFSIALKT